MKYYIGIYNDYLLAISTSKKLVKKYLEDVRNISKDKYKLIKVPSNTGEVYLRLYSNRELHYYYGYYIPKDDIDILRKEIRELNIEYLKYLLNILKDISGSYSKLKSINKKSNSLIEELDKLDISNEEVIKAYLSMHLNITDNIDEYLNLLNIHNEAKLLDRQFKLKLNDITQ